MLRAHREGEAVVATFEIAQLDAGYETLLKLAESNLNVRLAPTAAPAAPAAPTTPAPERTPEELAERGSLASCVVSSGVRHERGETRAPLCAVRAGCAR